MQRERHLVLFLAFLVLCIGIFPLVLNAEPDLEDLEKRGVVYVEPTHVSKVKVEGEYKLDPYVKRRNDWGITFSLGYSTYEPVNMEPSFSNRAYSEVYGHPSIGMLGARIGVKRNMPIGSVAGEVEVDSMTNDHSDPTFVPSTLTLTPIHVGGAFYFDTIDQEPYIVPYVAGGAYIMIFKESLGGNSDNGSTAVAPFASGGATFSLDWIDRRASRTAYEDSGIQNSSIYLEARKYFASSSKKDPDFSNTVCFNGGLRLEF